MSRQGPDNARDGSMLFSDANSIETARNSRIRDEPRISHLDSPENSLVGGAPSVATNVVSTTGLNAPLNSTSSVQSQGLIAAPGPVTSTIPIPPGMDATTTMKWTGPVKGVERTLRGSAPEITNQIKALDPDWTPEKLGGEHVEVVLISYQCDNHSMNNDGHLRGIIERLIGLLDNPVVKNPLNFGHTAWQTSPLNMSQFRPFYLAGHRPFPLIPPWRQTSMGNRFTIIDHVQGPYRYTISTRILGGQKYSPEGTHGPNTFSYTATVSAYLIDELEHILNLTGFFRLASGEPTWHDLVRDLKMRLEELDDALPQVPPRRKLDFLKKWTKKVGRFLKGRRN